MHSMLTPVHPVANIFSQIPPHLVGTQTTLVPRHVRHRLGHRVTAAAVQLLIRSYRVRQRFMPTSSASSRSTSSMVIRPVWKRLRAHCCTDSRYVYTTGVM